MPNQKGFTLVELMVAIILGSVVAASGITLYLTAQKTYLLQEGFLSNQSNMDIAFQKMTDAIQKSSKTNKFDPTSKDPQTGIVLSATNYGYSTTIDTKYLSHSESGMSFVNKGSDQLVVQYTPQILGGYDCEGRKITNYDKVVERYFVRQSTANSQNLVLACSAGRYSSGVISGMTNTGQTLIDGIDYFHALLMVYNDSYSFRSMKISDYNAMTNKPYIVGVQLGVLLHSNKPIGFKGIKNIDSTIPVLDENVKLNATVRNGGKKYVYETVTQAVSIRTLSGSIK